MTAKMLHGTVIHARRTALGMSRAELARKVGVARATIMHAEEGRPGTAWSTVVGIAHALGLPLSALTSTETA